MFGGGGGAGKAAVNKNFVKTSKGVNVLRSSPRANKATDAIRATGGGRRTAR
jgi:hypothetical protein